MPVHAKKRTPSRPARRTTRRTISWHKLTKSEQELVDAAVNASQAAYCPYSNFPVGAAIEAWHGEHTDSRIFTGCNVENASYGLAVCAERVASFSAVSQGYRRFTKVAVICAKHPASNGSPCGACRQVLREFGQDAQILVIVDRKKSVQRWLMSELLPCSFGPDSL